MRNPAVLFALVGVLIQALQKYEETDGKQIGKTSYKPGDLLGRLSVNNLEEEGALGVEPARQRHKTSMVKSESGENVYEPPLEVVEVVDRDDHDDLPDFADFPTEEPVPMLQLTPPDALTAKEIFRMDPTAIKVETKIKVTTFQKAIEAAPVVEKTVEMERAGTATIMMIPEFVMTTVTPNHQGPGAAPWDMVTPKPSDPGWVMFTPGIAPGPQEKGSPISTATNKYLRQNDALPDAMKLISDLLDDSPVFVTETFYITSRMMRTPVPKPKATATSTSTYQKKYEKGKAIPTTMTRLKINTGLLRNFQPFTIAPNDIYRGVHAMKSMASRLTVSLLILSVSCSAFLMLFL